MSHDPVLEVQPAAPSTPETRPVELPHFERELQEHIGEFDFFQVLRRLEAAHPDKPRLGTASKPDDEPVRLQQPPSMSFAPATLSRYEPAQSDRPAHLGVNFFGLLGPNGPLPLHITEYVHDRLHNSDDATLARFLDIFHHRMLMLFYRSWANSQPAASVERPGQDGFTDHVASLVGLGLPAMRNRDTIPDRVKLYFAGRLSNPVRNAEGLEAMISDFFQMPARVESFVGEWAELPEHSRWKLGSPAALGLRTVVGKRVWLRQGKFRVVMGPLGRKQFRHMLPEGHGLPQLKALVQTYAGDRFNWDLRLVPKPEAVPALTLGQAGRLGRTAWLGRVADGATQDELIIDPRQVEAA